MTGRETHIGGREVPRAPARAGGLSESGTLLSKPNQSRDVDGVGIHIPTPEPPRAGAREDSRSALLPVDADLPVECFICRRSGDGLVEAPNGEWMCDDVVECNYRTRRRLGIPRHVCELGRSRDLEFVARRVGCEAEKARLRAERLRDAPASDHSAEYLAHISSAGWKKFREERLIEARYRCGNRRCRKKGNDLEVHHITYQRFGHEWPEDVVVLCPACHRDWDDERRERRKGRVR